jgi:membrane protease YdiL (CAAX protease family)
MQPDPTRKQDAKLAAGLAAAGAVSAVAVIPYVLELLEHTGVELPVHPVAFAAAQGAQAGVLMGLMSWAGLRWARGRGALGAPRLRAALAGKWERPWSRDLWRAGALGALAAAVILALDLAFAPFMPPPIGEVPPSPSWWAGLLACLYGGVGEELMLRLFAMTGLATLAARLKGDDGMSQSAVVTGLLAATLLFGAGHLPAAAAIWELDAVVITRTLALNGVAGLAFGWLYWRKGLLAAMCSHLCADVVLHVLPPLLMG